MSLRLAFVFALAFALLIPAPAWSQATTENLTGERLQGLLGDLGFTGSELDEDGDVFVNMQGYRVLIQVGSHEGERLLARIALVNTGATLSWVNEWNKDRMFSRAFLDADGDPVLESDLDLEGGVSEVRIKNFLLTYSESVRIFVQEVPDRVTTMQ